MKILHICPDFPVYSNGGETFDLLSRYWANAGHQVTVITSRPHDSEKKSSENSQYLLEEFIMSKFVSIFPEAKLFFPLMRSERNRLKTFITNHSKEYDIVLIHGLLESVSRTCIRNIKDLKNVFLTNHGLSMGSFNPVIKVTSSLFYLILGNIFVRRIKYMTVYSNFALKQQSKFFGKLSTITKFQFPLGIETLELRNYLRNLNNESFFSVSNYIFAVGRQVRVKGFEILLKSFKTVKEKFPSENLVIAGKNNDYTRELIDLASKLGVKDSVHFLDYIDERKKIEVIVRSDTFVIPSLSEGYGLNSVYAKILDVPTVATDTGNHKEILSGSKHALIVKPGNADQLSDAIIRLLKIKDSMHRSPDMKALDYFDIENTAREYLRIFEQVLTYS